MNKEQNLLGKIVMDKITGYQGVATSKHIYLTGCNQYGIQQTVGADGKIPDVVYFDEFRLAIIKDFITAEEVQGDKNGCDYREKPNNR